jgi:hypothetical protein
LLAGAVGIGEYSFMERFLDLDLAAAEITQRQPAWVSLGLTVGPVTWRDEADVWPHILQTDRARVADPDSVGVRIQGIDNSEVEIVLFRGGWADLNAVKGPITADTQVVTECPKPVSPEEFGLLLDSCIERFLS